MRGGSSPGHVAPSGPRRLDFADRHGVCCMVTITKVGPFRARLRGLPGGHLGVDLGVRGGPKIEVTEGGSRGNRPLGPKIVQIESKTRQTVQIESKIDKNGPP